MFHSCGSCQSARPTVSASPATSTDVAEPRTNSANSLLMLSIRLLSVPGSARSRLPNRFPRGEQRSERCKRHSNWP